MQQTATIDGVSYTLATIRNKDARELSDPKAPTVREIARASFIAGGQTAEQWEELPLYGDYTNIDNVGLDVNGMKRVAAQGEDQAPPQEGAAEA